MATFSGRMICGDSRELETLVPFEDPRVRAIITSPPYLDTQNYQVARQIGFGQSHGDYLADLRRVFAHCWELSTDDATMWLVVGALRRSGRLIQLPEVLTSLASEAGWIPREQVTWAKGKSLPWARPGEFRNVTEQAIFLSKTDSFLFNLDDLLSPDPTSSWWQRYPERYSPVGRRPTNLWNIPIPTQGSWKQGPAHLCPFPHELTFRMISLTSEPGDVILDPFAGIGSVPAMANAMGRLGFGVEIAQRYVDRFPITLEQSHDWFIQRKREIEDSKCRQKIFHNTIVELRLLKFGRIIGKHLVEAGFPLEWVHVIRTADMPEVKHKITTATFEVKVGDLQISTGIIDLLNEISKQRPLSKFGVQPLFQVTDSERPVPPQYWYRNGRFWAEPELTKPVESGLHLASDFKPRVQKVLDMNPRPEGMQVPNPELDPQLNHETDP